MTVASLPDHHSVVASETSKWRELDSFAARWQSDPLLWAVLPKLSISLLGIDVESDSARLMIAARNVGRGLVPSFGPTVTRVGPALFVSVSKQTARVLEPVVSALENLFGPRCPESLPTISLVRLATEHRRAVRLINALRTALTESGFALPSGIYEELTQTALLLARSEGLMTRTPPEIMIVATQHNSAVRAVLAAAYRAKSVRTLYVPHAPAANTPTYRDLPVHFALMRGTPEVDFYESLGAPRCCMTSVGDPSIPSWPSGTPASDGPVVYAASPTPRDELKAIIAVIRDAHLERVEVAPHPRMNAADLMRLCPRDWSLNPLRSTFDRLRTNGARTVIQRGSGIGLEALALGLPLADLRNPGRQPNYLYLDSKFVAPVHDSESLAEAVRTADRSDRAVELRRSFAQSWCSRAGVPAAEAAAREIADIRERPMPDRLALDAWGKTMATPSLFG